MTTEIEETISLPEALYRRMNITAMQTNRTVDDLLFEVVHAYIADPSCASTAQLPPPTDRRCSTSWHVPADLHARMTGLHPDPATSFSDIIIRALYQHFDMLDADAATQSNIHVEIPQESYDRLAEYAAEYGATAEDALRRALATLVYNPPAIGQPSPLPADQPLYSGGIRYGKDLAAKLQDVFNRTAWTSTTFIQEAAAQYLAALKGEEPAPAAPTPPPPPKPVITPAARAQSKRLRL